MTQKERNAPFFYLSKIYIDVRKFEDYYPLVWGVVSASLFIVISLSQRAYPVNKGEIPISLQRDQRNQH